MKETRSAVIGTVKLKAISDNGKLTKLNVSSGSLSAEEGDELIGWLENIVYGYETPKDRYIRVEKADNSQILAKPSAVSVVESVDSPIKRSDQITIVDMETGFDETAKRLKVQ